MSSPLLIPWFTVEPIALRLPWVGELTLQPFGLLVLLGLAVGTFVAVLFARAYDRSPKSVLDLAIFLVIFIFPVSYVLDTIFYEPDNFRKLIEEPSRFGQVPLGMSSFGGIVGAVLGAFAWRWWSGGSFLRVGEACAFAAPFGWTFGRLGCFVSHDHPGRVSESWLAVEGFRVGAPPYLPRHDMGLYDTLLMFTIAIVFTVLVRRPRPVGFYVALAPMLYSPVRFALDFLRAPADDGGDVRYFGLTPGQYAALSLFAVGAALMCYVLREPGTETVRHGCSDVAKG